MKKTRFIPYGYTMRNGRTVIEHGEADIIRYIFDEYIKGASLKDLAEELTARKVPYTEKTEVWDKARIARIIDNAKYTGSEIYDPIIDEDMIRLPRFLPGRGSQWKTPSSCSSKRQPDSDEFLSSIQKKISKKPGDGRR